MKAEELKEVAKLLRYYILLSTTKAGSGHPTSSFSSVEIITTLFFNKIIKIDFSNPKKITNDRFILSKGHAAPLLYSLYAILGYVDKKELLNLRRFESDLQGHPIPDDFLVDVAVGSLGQGLSVGLGMAMGLKLKIKNLPRVWVLLGDSELAEGQIWEAVELAGFYKVDNLIAIVDVNRLGQRGETMVGWQLQRYQKRFSAFDWEVFLIDDGHNFEKLTKGFQMAFKSKTNSPKVILAKTIKGKGVSFLEDKDNWHGKALSEDLFKKAIKEIKVTNEEMRIKKRNLRKISQLKINPSFVDKVSPYPSSYKRGEMISTRKAFGKTLEKIGEKINEVVVLDAEVSNSTFSDFFKRKFPGRFFEMFVAEQNMISCALGFSKVGFIPFCCSFSAFLTRSFDQIRMANYSNANLKIIGSHAGVSIGEDGVSQMGLEDLSMMRAIFGSVVFYPCEAVSTEKLVFESLKYPGIVYLRTTRGETPVIYDSDENFEIGGFKVLRSSSEDKATIVASGITVFEALKAYEELKKQNIFIRLIDLYCIKPLNKQKLIQGIGGVKNIITVGDHYLEGGLGEVISSALSKNSFFIYHLAVKKMPRSGTKEKLFAYEKIDSQAIIAKVKEILRIDKRIEMVKAPINENKNQKITLNTVLKKLESLANVG